MQVIVMRHGDAVFKGADRVLSAKGEQEAKLTALKLASTLNITRIFSSPKQRALQTASIVQGLLRGRQIPQIEVLNELSPYGDARMVRDFVEAVCEPNDTVLLISHIPQVLNLSFTFTQQDLDLPTFYTAGALILKHQASEGQNFTPSCFYTPNSEQPIRALPATTTAASAAYSLAAKLSAFSQSHSPVAHPKTTVAATTATTTATTDHNFVGELAV